MKPTNTLPMSSVAVHPAGLLARYSAQAVSQRISAQPRANKRQANAGYQVGREGQLVTASDVARSKVADVSALVEINGILQPVDPLQHFEWFETIKQVLDDNQPRLCQVTRSPEIMHALLEPDAERDLVFVTLETGILCNQGVFDVYTLHYRLTPCETDVLWKLSMGLEPKRVASVNQVSEHTVRTHVKAVLSKTNEPNIRSILIRLARLSQSGFGNAHNAHNAQETAITARWSATRN